ncbi:Xaa-Pro aminopeptidase [Malassezia brasiliensis]|uniref:Exocyst complex component Sec8 n=1 Tax=Malassezia brasiliensis TaxID=1821822 RepID=A0AAF0IQJ8_9BASI|nr:Xaa-Pro aminopeptidase [Malassezia brasiliensis]
MLKRSTGSKRRPQIRHENEQLGRGAGVTEGPIVVPGHNAFPGGAHEAPRSAPPGVPGAVPPGGAYVAAPAAYAPAPAPEMGVQGTYGAPMYAPQPSVPAAAQVMSTSTPPPAAHAAAGAVMPDAATSPRRAVPAYAPSSAPTSAGPVGDVRASMHTPFEPAYGVASPGTASPAPVPTPGGARGLAVPADGTTPAPTSPGAPPPSAGRESHQVGESPAPSPSPAVAPMPGVRSRLRPAPSAQAPVSPSIDAEHPVVGSLSSERQPAALDAVLGALTEAGRKRQTARVLRGGLDTAKRAAPMPPMVPGASRSVSEYVDASDAPKFRALNAALRKIKSEWPFLLDDRFNPLALSLGLLSDASLRARLGDFASLNDMIERTLQGTLDDHYESFALAITVNHGMVHSLGDAQELVGTTRTKLQHARDALGAKRADLVQMWQRIETLKEAMRVLGLVEQLRSVPDELETLMAEKQFLRATQLLMRSLRLIQREELAEVGATADLRAYLRAQEHALLEILVEEVHNHLYLKSTYCDARWRSYVHGQDTLPDVVFGEAYAPEARTEGARPTKLVQFLHVLRTRVAYGGAGDGAEEREADVSLADAADVDADGAPRATQNPEQDSFVYLEMLLESLARLGKIGYALEVIGQRLPFEVHQLVDATIDEVDRRHDPARYAVSDTTRTENVLFAPSALTASFIEDGGARRSFSLANAAQLGGARAAGQHELAALQRDMETMRDFFWTLFSKLDAVLQGHRVVQEIATALFQRADTSASAAADRASAELGVAALVRVWQAVEYEVRALLHDYLSEDTHAVVQAASAQVPSLNELLRGPRYERDKTRALFRMADVRRQQNAVRRAEDTVDAALRTFVPGLVGQEATRQAPSALLHDAPGALARPEEYTGAAHRLLVRPLTFTVSVLFQPTLAFIERVAEILPADAAGSSARGFGGFLREFVQMMFLPMLEDKVQQLVSTATHGAEAFAPDTAKRAAAARPVVRSAAQIVALVDSLYTMLQAAPVKRASYARLILVVFVEYYERCNERFKQLVSEDMEAAATHAAGPYVRAAVWAQRPGLYRLLCDVRTAGADARAAPLREEEARLERRYADEAPVRRADLMTSRKRLLALGHLHFSVQWLHQHMAQLRAAAEHEDVRRDTPDGVLPLPLSAGLVPRFTEIVRLYEHLAQFILLTLRVELRLKALHALRLAFTEGTYIVDGGALEPDSHVLEWNSELTAFSELLKDTLSAEHQQFVLDGLDVLLDAVMVEGVRSVRAINRHGVTKMLRNILSLQQNLKNLAASPQRVDLERSKKFWEMLAHEPEQWLATVRHAPAPHSFAEYKAALDLCLGVDRSTDEPASVDGVLVRVPHAGTSRNRAVTTQRYNELLIELHECAKTAR